MCELLGISIQPTAQMGVYFHAFRPRAELNQSGWGVGWYENGEARIIKEPARADHSDKAVALGKNQPSSELFIIHVRKATVGEISMQNTHPFLERLHGKEWVFAHNGTIENLGRLSVDGFVAQGTTDSEVAFHHLLNRLSALPEGAADQALANEILQGAAELSQDGKVNFLLSDGRTLYAYHDGHKSLYFLERTNDPDHVRLKDEMDYTVDLKLPPTPNDSSVIIASVPLTKEAWTKLEPGEFLACREGRVVQRVSASKSA